MRSRLALALATAALAAVLVAVVPGAAGAATRAAVARKAANDFLAALQLPAGATPSDSVPSGTGLTLQAPVLHPTSSQSVDVHRFWVVPGDPRSVLAYVEAHAPAGAGMSSNGSNTLAGHRSFFASFQLPATSVLASRTLLVTVSRADGGKTGLRADAQVVWKPHRPAWDHVHGARSVRVNLPGSKAVVTDGATVRRMERILDRLRVDTATVHGCPDTGAGSAPPVMELRFRDASGHTFADSLVDASCGVVTLSVHGRRGPNLAGASTTYKRLRALLP
jgi:hypothetical protein